MSRPAVFSPLSFEEALAAAKARRKLLVLDATAEWCAPCKQMDVTTWVAPSVVEWLGEHAVAIQIDVDQDLGVARELRVKAMPTVVVFREGEEFARSTGLKPPAALVAWLEAARRGESVLDGLAAKVRAGQVDASGRLDFARQLVDSNRLDEAGEEYAWLFDHILELEPAMVGVRGSFLACAMQALAASHEPSRERFRALRERLEPAVASGRETGSERGDWLLLNWITGDDERTLAWVDSQSALPLTVELDLRVVPLLIERGRWADVARVYVDPVARLVRQHDLLQSVEAHQGSSPLGADHREESLRAYQNMFVELAERLCTALLAVGRSEEAEAVASEARRLRPSRQLDEALERARARAEGEPIAFECSGPRRAK